jgi:hypothetical protein
MSPWSHPTTIPPGPMTRDLAPRPGVTLVEGGADVAVYAGHADAVELCLFDAGDKAGTSERRIPLLERAHGWWFAFVPGITAGQRYNFRAHGAWSPDQGLRHNPAKLLLDPYAKAIEGKVRWGAEVYGHVVDVRWHGDGELISGLDSRGHMPRGVVVDDRFDWEGDVAPNRSRSESVIYEAHVRNQTALHPGVPPELRGTYAGLAHPASVAHLTSLGVTAVELLPVHAFTHEPHLVRRGLTNHWGYNTLGFFAPHGAYAAAKDPQGAVDEFKGMVKLLHGRASRSSSTSSTTTPPSRARTGAPCRGAGWTTAPTTASTSGAATSTSPGAATPSTCATRSSVAWCWTRCATGCRSATSTASASTWRSPRPRTRGRLRPRPPLPRGAAHRPRALGHQAHRRAVGRRHARLAHRPVPAAVRGVERPLPR